MKNRLFFLLKYYAFWLCFAFVARMFFILYFYQKTNGLGTQEYLMIFQKGLRMDLSLGGYVMLVSSAFLALFNYLPSRWAVAFFRVFTVSLLVIFISIILGDFQVYSVWGYHLDSSVVGYLKTPREAMASGSTKIIILSVCTMLLLTFCFYFIFNRLILRRYTPDNKKWWHSFVFLIIGGLAVIPIRGGFNVAPMNPSFVYFSKKHPFANQAAVNPVWNFLYELMHYHKRVSTYHFMEQASADALLDSIYHTSGNEKSILKTSSPNIVFLLLESFTSNAIQREGITPNLNRLAKEGIYFSNIYATGARSDRGLAGVLSATPAHPSTPILTMPKKSTVLPTLAKDLERKGYNTHFYYTGDINFGGFRAFTTANFQHIVTEKDFSGEAVANRMKWGVHDEYMFDKLFEDIRRAPSPSFFFAFTLSSHEPFEVPGKKRVKGKSNEAIFLNSVAYTDAELGKFIARCKQSEIWQNSLFILIADHGVRYVGNPPANDLKSFHIPMIFAGGALAKNDTVVTQLGSQTDVVATVLSQLKIDHSAYRYSRNLLADSVPNMVFFANPGAVGVYSDKGVSIFDINAREFIEGEALHENCRALKAYLQTIDHEQLD